MLRRHCLALDLKDDPAIIAEYDRYHRAVWPEIMQSLRDAGIDDMEIYRIENRLFMIIEVTESFTFEAKQAADLKSAIVQKWETLMGNFQQPLRSAKSGEKWLRMTRVFSLRIPNSRPLLPAVARRARQFPTASHFPAANRQAAFARVPRPAASLSK